MEREKEETEDREVEREEGGIDRQTEIGRQSDRVTERERYGVGM